MKLYMVICGAGERRGQELNSQWREEAVGTETSRSQLTRGLGAGTPGPWERKELGAWAPGSWGGAGGLDSWVRGEERAGWGPTRALGEEGARGWTPRSWRRRGLIGPMPGPYLSGRACHKPSVCLGPSVQTEPSQVAGLSAPWVPQIP